MLGYIHVMFTGSNSVNVFLGLGLPWVLLSMYYRFYLNYPYQVQSDNLTQAVLLFVIVGGVCLITLLIRRFVSNHWLHNNNNACNK